MGGDHSAPATLSEVRTERRSGDGTFAPVCPTLIGMMFSLFSLGSQEWKNPHEKHGKIFESGRSVRFVEGSRSGRLLGSHLESGHLHDVSFS